jgi:hypothetical protein
MVSNISIICILKKAQTKMDPKEFKESYVKHMFHLITSNPKLKSLQELKSSTQVIQLLLEHIRE